MPASQSRSQTIQRPYTVHLEPDDDFRLATINLKEGTFEGAKWKFAPRSIRSLTEGGRSTLYQPLWPADEASSPRAVKLLTGDNEEYFPKSVPDLLDTKSWQTDMDVSEWALIGIKIDRPGTDDDLIGSVQPPGEYIARLMFEAITDPPYTDYLVEMGKRMGRDMWSQLTEIILPR